MAKKEFLDETVGKAEDEIPQKIEPKMLPPRFRERTVFWQRLFVFTLMFFYSIAVGTITFTLLSGLASKMNKLYFNDDSYLTLTMVFSLVSLIGGAIAPIWGKNRKSLITASEFIIMMVSPIIFIFAYIYLSYNFNYKTAKELLFFVGTVSAGATALPALLNLVKVIYNKRRFRASLIKSLWMLPGCLLIGAGNIMLWMSTPEQGAIVLSFNSILYPTIAVGGGLFLIIIGGFIGAMQNVKGARNIWTAVRLSGALPSLTIFSALLAVGMRFMSMELSKVVMFSAIVDVVLLLGLSAFAWFRGRIKNLNKTNPIYNNIILKGFIILTAASALIFIELMDKVSFLRDFGPPSYTILAFASLTILIGVFIAHLTKLIVYTKFFKATIASSLASLLIVVTVVISIVVLKNSEIIVSIIARQIVTLFLTVTIILEVIVLFVDILSISLSIANQSRKIKKEEKIPTRKRG